MRGQRPGPEGGRGHAFVSGVMWFPLCSQRLLTRAYPPELSLGILESSTLLPAPGRAWLCPSWSSQARGSATEELNPTDRPNEQVSPWVRYCLTEQNSGNPGRTLRVHQEP